jgi:hypothetical protein
VPPAHRHPLPAPGRAHHRRPPRQVRTGLSPHQHLIHRANAQISRCRFPHALQRFGSGSGKLPLLTFPTPVTHAKTGTSCINGIPTAAYMPHTQVIRQSGRGLCWGATRRGIAGATHCDANGPVCISTSAHSLPLPLCILSSCPSR